MKISKFPFILAVFALPACALDTDPVSVCVDSCVSKGYTQAACEKSCALSLDPNATPEDIETPYELCRKACIDKGSSTETCNANCERTKSLPNTATTCIQNCDIQSPDASAFAACIQHC